MQKFKNSFLFGTMVLIACNIITKVIGAIYRVPLLNILGSEGLGLYQLIFPVFAVMLVVSSSGINVAVSKFVSAESLTNNKKNIKKYLQSGFVLAFLVSTFFSVILLLISPLISKYQGNNSLAICYYAILPSIILSSLVAVFKGYFLGKRQMLYTGGLQVIEQIIKLIFSLMLASAFVERGIIYAVFGTVLGLTLSEIITFAISALFFIGSKKKNQLKPIIKKQVTSVAHNIKSLKFYATRKSISFGFAIKKISKFGFFVSLQSCIMPLLGAIDSLTIVPMLIKTGLNNTVAYTLYGLEDGIVASLVSMPTVFASSFGQSLVPNIKSTSIEKSQKNIVESIRVVWLVGIASAFVFMFFANDIIRFLYGGGLGENIVYEARILNDLLILNSFNIIYLSLLNLSSSILQGLDDSKTPLINMGLCATLKILITLVTVTTKTINIYGTALADVVFYSLTFILNMIAIKRKIKICFSFDKIIVRPVLSAFAMILSMKLINFVLRDLLSFRISTLIMCFIGASIYIILLVFTKAIDLKSMLSGIFKKRKTT